MKFIKKIFKGLTKILIAPFALLYHVTFGRKNQSIKSITKRDNKGKTKPAEVKTASPEAKVETVTPKVETKEVEKEVQIVEPEVEELVEGLTEEKKVTVETPAEVITEAEEVIDDQDKDEEPEVDELGVPLDTKKKEAKKQETTFISSDNKKEEEVIAELAKAAANDTTAIANLRGVDLSTRFLKSQRDITEYYLYKQYGQEPTSVTVKALIDVEKSMDLLGDNSKSNTRSM